MQFVSCMRIRCFDPGSLPQQFINCIFRCSKIGLVQLEEVPIISFKICLPGKNMYVGDLLYFRDYPTAMTLSHLRL